MNDRQRDYEAERAQDEQWTGWSASDYDEAEIVADPEDDALGPDDDLFGRRPYGGKPGPAVPPRGAFARLWDALKTIVGR